MRLVGLTGGIASGKSTVCRIIKRNGVPLIDADELSRKVVEPGMPAYQLIVKHFSRDILHKDGTIDRQKLGDIIFADQEKRRILNRCTHPFIRRGILKLVALNWIRGEKIVVLDAPLLIEASMVRYMSAVVVVYCSEEQQLSRLMKRDGMSEVASRQRINSQMPLREKVQFADFVIDNSGSLDNTERQTNDVIARLRPRWWAWLLTWLGPVVPAVLGITVLAAQMTTKR